MKSSLLEKANSFTTSSLMKYRNEIFGFSAIWIVLFHIFGHASLPPFPGGNYINRILSYGNMGVDIFLFLSALGLYYSINKNTLSKFYTNRLKRVVLPYLILAVPYFIVYNFFVVKDGFLPFLSNLSTVNFWLKGDHPTWYVAFIVFAYALYPLIYKLNVKTRGISTIFLIIFSVIFEYILLKMQSPLYINAERALSRIPIFLFGILISDFLLNKTHKINLFVVVASFCAIIYMILIIDRIHIVLMRFCYGIMAVCIIVVYSFIRTLFNIKIVSNLLKWVGTISLEIYIVHVFIIRIVNYNNLWNKLPGMIWYISIVAITMFLAKALSQSVKLILCSKNKIKGA